VNVALLHHTGEQPRRRPQQPEQRPVRRRDAGSLGLAERVGAIEEICACLINLGLLEMARGNLEDAIACDRRAVEQFERVEHGAGRAMAYGNLAEKLMLAGELDKALRIAERALDLAGTIGHPATSADVM